MSTRGHVLLGATLITKLSQEVLLHKVLSSRGVPEQKPEVRMNGESESSKNLGKSFQVDRRSSKWPQGGKAQLYEDWMESKQKQSGKTKWENSKRQSQKDRVHITQNLEDHGQGLALYYFYRRKLLESIRQRSDRV